MFPTRETTMKKEKELVKFDMSLSLERLVRDKVQTMYVVNNQWFISWKKYVDYNRYDHDIRPIEELEALHPGKILNRSLVENIADEALPCKILKPNLIEESDFVLIPPSSYKLLKLHYDSDCDIQRYRLSLRHHIIL